MDTESELEVARVIAEDAGDVDNAPSDNHNLAEPLPASPTSSTASLKRPAGDMDDERDSQPQSSNKRQKRESVSGGDESGDGTDAARLVRDMEVELGCPCCSALCYNPVITLPCQHYFCGSCYTMWTKYTGVTCPTCRQAVNQVIPSRAIQSIIEVYLRSVPSKARLPREMEQADEIYAAGSNIRIPTPRPRSPELAPPQDNDAYYRPCPHCNSPNDFNWVCSQPIIDPSVDISRASLLTDGPPPGHGVCGSCEHLHATGAPSTSRCDFCRKTFCGLVSPQRCHARRVREAKPALLEGLSDLIVTPEAYHAFGVNAVEWEYLVDYLRDQGIGPRHIYVTIVESILRGSEKWKPLFEVGLFPEAVAAALDDSQPRQRNVETDSASTSGSEAGAAGGSDEHQDDDNPRDAEMPGEPHPPPDTNAVPSSDAVSRPPTDANPASNPNPEPVPTPQHDTEMSDAAPAQSAPAEPVAAEHPSSDAMAVASALVDAILGAESVASPVETRAITPISVPTPQPEVDTIAILLDSAAAEFVPPVEVEPPSGPPVPPVATDNSQEPEGSPSTSDSASGTAVTSISGSESVPSIPPSNSNEGSTSSSPADAAQGDVPNANTNPNANTSAGTTNPSGRPRAANLHLSKICRWCALEVFYWGARQWWVKERANAHTEGTLPRTVRERKDCPDMFQYVKKEGEEGDGELVVGICPQEDDHSHARGFNHIPRPPGWVPPPPTPPTPEQHPESIESSQDQPPNTSPDSEVDDRGSVDGGNPGPEAEMVGVVEQQPAAVSDAAAVSNGAAASTQDAVLERPAGETDATLSDPAPTIPQIASSTAPGETAGSGSGNSASHVRSGVDRMDVDIPSLPTPEDKSIVPPTTRTEPHTGDAAMTSSAAGSQVPTIVQA